MTSDRNAERSTARPDTPGWWTRTDPWTVARSWAGAGRLARRAARSSDPLVDRTTRAEVALTSYGPRLDRVHVVIESIGAGVERPGALRLCVADEAFVSSPPDAIRRQIDRGLSVELVTDDGPHKKYRPSVLDDRRDPTLALVTADDDALYPRRWLAALLEVHRRHPTDVVGHRVRRLRVTDRVAPYRTWPLVEGTRASHHHVPTGVGGVLYPPAMVAALRAHDPQRPAATDRCDDLWLHWVALRAGVRARQVAAAPLVPVPMPGLGDDSLMAGNVEGGGNDGAIAALYTRSDVEQLRREAERDRDAQRSENPANRPTTR